MEIKWNSTYLQKAETAQEKQNSFLNSSRNEETASLLLGTFKPCLIHHWHDNWFSCFTSHKTCFMTACSFTQTTQDLHNCTQALYCMCECVCVCVVHMGVGQFSFFWSLFFLHITTNEENFFSHCKYQYRENWNYVHKKTSYTFYDEPEVCV